jgi:hypothetical protein
MPLYLIERTDDICFDEMVRQLVRAKSQKEARKLASENIGDEGVGVWLDKSRSTIEIISSKGKSCVIMDHYKNG